MKLASSIQIHQVYCQHGSLIFLLLFGGRDLGLRETGQNLLHLNRGLTEKEGGEPEREEDVVHDHRGLLQVLGPLPVGRQLLLRNPAVVKVPAGLERSRSKDVVMDNILQVKLIWKKKKENKKKKEKRKKKEEKVKNRQKRWKKNGVSPLLTAREVPDNRQRGPSALVPEFSSASAPSTPTSPEAARTCCTAQYCHPHHDVGFPPSRAVGCASAPPEAGQSAGEREENQLKARGPSIDDYQCGAQTFLF